LNDEIAEHRSKTSTKMMEKGLLMTSKNCSSQYFNSLGLGYSLPVADHKYEIKHGLKFGDFGVKRSSDRFMDTIVKRARSCVAPNKYS